MIAENEFVLDREKTFKGLKYVVVIKLEKADSADDGDWAGKIAALKSYIDNRTI